MNWCANQPDTPAASLARFATSPDDTVRLSVVQHPTTLEETLSALAIDKAYAVAAAARQKLAKRYPDRWPAMAAKLPPMPAAATSPNPREFIAEWRAAVRSSNGKWLRELIAQAKHKELDRCLSETDSVLVAEFRPEIFEIYLEQFRRRGMTMHTYRIVALAATNPEWLRYFESHGISQSPDAPVALAEAVSLGVEHVDALLKTGFKPVSMAALLDLAIRLRDCEVLERLLREAPDLDRASTTNDFGESLLEMACNRRNAGAISLLDQNGAHASLVREILNEFPSTQGSKFVGHWRGIDLNGKDVVLKLRADSTGSMDGFPVDWKLVPAGAQAFLSDAWGSTGKERPLVLMMDADTLDTLVIKGPTPILLKRTR